MRPDEMMDFLDELQDEAKSYDNFEDWFEYIKAYSDELKEQAAKEQNVKQRTGTVGCCSAYDNAWSKRT